MTIRKLTGSDLINVLATAAEVLVDCDIDAGRYAALADTLGDLQEEYGEELDHALESAVDIGLTHPTVGKERI